MTMGRKLDWLLFFFWWHPGWAPVPWHTRDLPDLVHKACQKNTCKYSGVIASSWRPIWEQISFYLNIHFYQASRWSDQTICHQHQWPLSLSILPPQQQTQEEAAKQMSIMACTFPHHKVSDTFELHYVTLWFY